jgi:hypothetical protein
MLEPGTIDGLVYASSMVILHAARHRLPVPRLARWRLALGIAASLAVNVAQGWSHDQVGLARHEGQSRFGVRGSDAAVLVPQLVNQAARRGDRLDGEAVFEVA